MTLAELFDLVISDDKDLREGYLISPLLEIKYVGKKGFFDTIKSLSKVKFENKCKIKWMEKYKKFLNCYRVKGSHPYSWSFAVNKEGEKMAKFKCGTIYLPRHRKKYTIQESNNFNTPQKEILRPTAWPAGNTTAA